VNENEYDVDALAAELPIVTERGVICDADATPVSIGANEATVMTATTTRRIFFFSVFIAIGYFLIFIYVPMVLS